MDWLNFKELIGCILIEQALGTQFAAMTRIEAWVNPQLRAKIQRTADKYGPQWSINRFAASASYIGTALSVICLYIALDFFLNVF